jgi:hypothetical protein
MGWLVNLQLEKVELRKVENVAINLDVVLVNLVVSAVVISPILWLSGRALVGKEKAKFADALWIAILGAIIGMVFGYFFVGIVAAIIQLIIWLALVKHFFDCGWLMALAISVVAVIIFAVIFILLGLLGFALGQFLPTI